MGLEGWPERGVRVGKGRNQALAFGKRVAKQLGRWEKIPNQRRTRPNSREEEG